jgi:hypothetical protein
MTSDLRQTVHPAGGSDRISTKAHFARWQSCLATFHAPRSFLTRIELLLLTVYDIKRLTRRLRH